MMKLVALVGMPGSGKTEVANIFIENGYTKLRMGQITLDEVIRRGEVSETSEKTVREEFRAKHGMGAFAILNYPKISELLRQGNVVIDNLMSWEEYLFFKEKIGKDFIMIAIYSSPETRYARLVGRKLEPNDKKAINRPTTREESISRDYSEIENLHKGGPIAMADFTIVNEMTVEELRAKVERIVSTFQ